MPIFDARAIGAALQMQPRERSYYLQQVLGQLNQPPQNPQSYGSLAAQLGAALLNKQAANKEMAAQQAQQQQQNQALAGALQQAQGGMTRLPVTGVQLDTLPDPSGAMQSLAASGHPLAGALAGQQLQQMLVPPPPPDDYSLGDTRFSGRTNKPIASNTKPEGPKSSIGQIQADLDNGLISPEQARMAVEILNKPLVSLDQGGAGLSSPPQGQYRPNKNEPGLAPEPGYVKPPAEIPAESKAKLGMLESSQRNANEARNVLFNKGRFQKELLWKVHSPIRQGDAATLYNKMFEAMSNRLRAESGANISDAEIQSQTERFLPKPWDSEAVAKQKFDTFDAFINDYRNSVGGEQAAPRSGNTLRFDKNGNPL